MTTATTTYSAADLAALAGQLPAEATTPTDEAKAIDPRLCDRTDADKQLQQRQMAAWDAYYGRFKNSVEKAGAAGRDRNVKANRCAAIVDKTAAWLSKGLTIEVADKDAPAGGGTSKAGKPGQRQSGGKAKPQPDRRQMALDDILGDQDRFKAFLTMVYTSGSVTGHAYVKINYDEAKYRQRGDLPSFRLLDSQNVYVLTHPDDCNIPLVYVVEYQTPIQVVNAGGYTQARVTRQIIARVAKDGTPRYGMVDSEGNLPDGADEIADDDEWTIATYRRVAPSGAAGVMAAAVPSMGAGAWKLTKDGVMRWPYPFPPIADCMNLPAPTQYYGQPDLVPEIIHLNQRINDVQTDTATVLEAYGMPIPWATGYDSMQSAIRLNPGELLPLPNNATAGVLQPRGDIASNRDFANDLRADMDERSRVPAVALGRQESLPKGNISGVALALLFQPLIEKILLQRVLYGPMISCLCLWSLVLVGVATLDDTEIRLHWADLLPKDDAATAQMVTAMSAVGVSDHAIDETLGLDYEEEQEYKQEEAQNKANAMITGKALPELPLDDGTQPQQQPQQPGQPPTQPQGNMAALNSPAAVAARTHMQQMAGGQG